MIEILLEKITQKTAQNDLFFLWGMPCSGKSTIGKRLATQLGYVFIDLDEYIVSQEKETIPQIFQTKGENYFRMMETHYLHEIIEENSHQKTIISTGGGTPCFNENAIKMLENGFCIFLDVGLDTLTTRLGEDTKNLRPLFINKTDNEIKESLSNLYQSRIEHYKKAHFIFQEYA